MRLVKLREGRNSKFLSTDDQNAAPALPLYSDTLTEDDTVTRRIMNQVLADIREDDMSRHGFRIFVFYFSLTCRDETEMAVAIGNS